MTLSRDEKAVSGQLVSGIILLPAFLPDFYAWAYWWRQTVSGVNKGAIVSQRASISRGLTYKLSLRTV
jgi:hypothetical protein